MALTDQFENLFEHTHVHTFVDVTPEERDAWLRQTLQTAQEAGIALIHQKIDEGYEFAFFDRDDWATFQSVLGGEHIVVQPFSTRWMQQECTALFCSFLDQRDIKYDVEVDDLETRFRFKNFADARTMNEILDGFYNERPDIDHPGNEI